MSQNLIAQAGDIFGKIEAPAEITEGYGVLGASGAGGGLTGFISNIIALITMVGGLWALFNILYFGFEIISSGGDSKKLAEAGGKFSNTFIGVAIMVAAPLLAALIGFFFFGDSSKLLSPTIAGPGSFLGN